CFRAASNLPRSSAFSARNLANSPSTCRSNACSVGTSSGKCASGVREKASMPQGTPPGPPGSALSSGNRGKAFEAADAGEVDAVQAHLHLPGAQLDGSAPRRRFRKVVASGFKALTPQAQAVAAPVEDLETVCGAVAEDEQVAAERVGFQTV